MPGYADNAAPDAWANIPQEAPSEGAAVVPVAAGTEAVPQAVAMPTDLQQGASSPQPAAETKVLRAAPPQLAWLVFLNGRQKGREVQLTSNDLMIGRDANLCGLVLEDEHVSAMHTRIRRTDDVWYVHDLGSTNHTYLNGDEIVKHELKDKDRLRIGNTEFVFVEVAERHK
jgi:predicted component of type VI protein secretion system